MFLHSRSYSFPTLTQDSLRVFVNPNPVDHREKSGILAVAAPSARGFTLIEIMIVVVILAMMAAVVVPNLMGRTDEARIAAAQTDIQTIMSALKLYNLDNSRFPTAEQGLAALVERPTLPPEPRNYKKGGYLERLPMDPWGNPYQYLNPGLHGKEVEVYSFGRDGTAGGEGIDADIGSW